MNKVIISCPYGSLEGLEKSFKKNSKNGDLIFSEKDITALDDNFVYIGKQAEKHAIKSFTRVFIRYPYDLIEPHTGTYKRRENTEFLKTLGLVFSDIAINSIKNAHFVRNRIYSLNIAKKLGFKIPESTILKGNNLHLGSLNNRVSKSLGNCFFAEKLPKTDKNLQKTLSFEEDDGDTAYIYSPHIINGTTNLQKHLNMFGTCFLQNKIIGKEYRIFIVKNELFIYQREEIKSLDKSSAGLIRVRGDIFKKYESKFKKLCKVFKLEYLCLDVIFNKEPIIIDINPFGSFPNYKLHPEVINSFAKLLLK